MAVQFTIRQGQTFKVKLTLLDKDTQVPINLTGSGFRMQIRLDENQDLLTELTDGNGKAVMGGIAGTVQLRLESSETIEFSEGVYRFDCFLVNGVDEDFLFEGTFEVVETISK